MVRKRTNSRSYSGQISDVYERQARVKNKNKEALERARRAIAVYGYTMEQAAQVAGVDERTVRRWKKAGLLGLGTVGGAGDLEEWTAAGLHDVGLDPDVAAALLMLFDTPSAGVHQRIREWLSRYSTSVPKAPPEWAAAIAFLPILGKDTQSPALEALADVMDDARPWENERQRRSYRRLAGPWDMAARAQMAHWLLAGGLTAPGRGPYDSLALAATAVLELARRLPNVDGPGRRGWGAPISDVAQELRGFSMIRLALSWCDLLDSDDAWLSAPAALQRDLAKVALNHARRRRRRLDHDAKRGEQP